MAIIRPNGFIACFTHFLCYRKSLRGEKTAKKEFSSHLQYGAIQPKAMLVVSLPYKIVLFEL